MPGLTAWRIRAVLALVAYGIRSVAAQQVNGTTAIDLSRVQARVATYRNGYGTHFQCTLACYFIMWAYLACVVALLVLLAVVPVQLPSKPENAPFVLWLGNNRPNDDDSVMLWKKKTPNKRVYGILDRLSMWIHGYEEAESSENENDARDATFHEDIDLLTQQAEPPAKTFESIGVETDDSLLPPPPPPLVVQREPDEDDLVLVQDVDTLFDALPPSPRDRKPGIFAPVAPRADPSMKFVDTADTDAGTSRRRFMAPLARQASITAAGGASELSTTATTPAGRRATVVGSTVSDTPMREDLITAVERRTSMHKRAEKRKEYAKSDIAHDNLHEHELHMYEYLEFVRSLLEGITLKKITQKSGKAVKRTFFVTPNLATVYWNQVGNKGWISKKSSIESTEISNVTKGAEGNAAGKLNQEKQELCITIVMNDDRRLVLEAKDATMRQHLFFGFSRLAVEKREEKRKREAGEACDDPQQHDERESDEALENAMRDCQQEEAEHVGKNEEKAAPPEEAERRAKSEEDDPTRWRVEPEVEQQRVDETVVTTNQAERLEDATLVSEDDDAKQDDGHDTSQ